MDPLTQGLVGAALSQSASKKGQLVVAGGFGLVAAMVPDLDVLIRSQHDPLLFLHYHRQFTHALLFIPFGSLLCALILHPIFGKKQQLTFHQSWRYCALGYATHALLDTCTSYGTQLLWPFSDERFAWSFISVIDPVFTLTLLCMLVIATIKQRQWLARIAMLWVVSYPLQGMLQHHRAEQAGWQLAASRQHRPISLQVKPSFGNLLLWKVIYQTPDRYYIDAIRAGRNIQVYPGASIAKLNVVRDLPWLSPDSQQAKDIDRFHTFSNGFLAQDPADPLRIIDVRYSLVPNQLNALWSIQLDPSAAIDSHVTFTTHRDATPATRQRFVQMLIGH